MKRFLLILFLAFAPNLWLSAQEEKFAELDSLLMFYCHTMQMEEMETKQMECDFMIESCKDSLTREHVARKLFDHYCVSNVMGEEAVAIYLYDKWFASGKLSIGGEFVAMDAEIFATFNRNSLLGMEAPAVSLKKPCGGNCNIPKKGETSVLFFYDTACSKCRAFSQMLPQVLDDASFKFHFYAIYCGAERKAWKQWRKEFKINNPKIKLVHLWDPEMKSDYQLQYGVISTPKMYLVEPGGTIMGRRLEPESLKELLYYAGAVQTAYNKTHHEKE